MNSVTTDRGPSPPPDTAAPPRDDTTAAPPDIAAATPDAAGAPRSSSAFVTVGALAGWAAIVAVGRWWGLRLLAQGTRLVLPTPPVLGAPGPGLTPWLIVPIVVGAVLIAFVPVAIRRLSWRAVLTAVVAGAIVWAVGVALVEGPAGLTRGPSWSSEYGSDVPTVASAPGHFLRTFTRDIGDYEIHVRGHPPGMVLILAGMDRAGLHGPGWEAALVIAAGGLAAAGALVAARELAGEDTARRAAPFVMLAPAAIWVATSADALFLGVATWGVTLVVLAIRRQGRRSDVLAVAGGVVLGAGLVLSYGLVLVAAVPVVVAIAARRARPVALAALGAAAVLAVFAGFGFWWLAGLLATKHQYDILDLQRPYRYFVVNNLSAWALALGPATAVALTRLRDRRLWLLVGGGAAAALAADVTGLSEGEVERIWLPFTIWVLLAGAALVGGPPDAPRWRAAQGWLAVQAASAIVLVALVTTQW